MDAIPARYAMFRSAGIAWGCAAVCLMAGHFAAAKAGGLEKAAWFPDPPAVKRFTWTGEACEGCKQLVPRSEWKSMAALAGL